MGDKIPTRDEINEALGWFDGTYGDWKTPDHELFNKLFELLQSPLRAVLCEVCNGKAKLNCREGKYSKYNKSTILKCILKDCAEPIDNYGDHCCPANCQGGLTFV